MRLVCRGLGASLTRNEVVLDQFVLANGGGPKSGRHLDPSDRPIACQLMGHDPEEMAAAAAKMIPWGYDILDLNFGCPVKKVLGRCRGGFLLSEPKTAIDMVRRARDAVQVPITIKMRRGSDDSARANEQFWEILERSVDLGIAGICVHGRTVQQRYQGPARWDIIAEVKKRFPNLFVFGSGDLFTAGDCLRMLGETGCDGVAIARGAIQNPWIFRECLAMFRGESPPPPPTIAEQADLLERQFSIAIAQYGNERASRQLRKFAIQWSAHHPESTAVRQALIELRSLDHWHEIRRRFYREPAAAGVL